MPESDPPITPPSRGEALDRFVPPLLLLAGVVGTIPVVRSLYVADLNWCYQYLSPDSYDWINNGLYWAGAPVLPSFRPPGLPLIMAGLLKVGALSWLPVLNFLALGTTACVLYVFLRQQFSPTVAALSAWLFYANDYSQDLARYVFAEVYATPLLVLAALCFFRAAERPGLYVPFGLALGASFLFHHAALPAGLGFAAVVVIWRRRALATRPLWAGAALALFIVGSWVAARTHYYRLHPSVPRHVQEDLIAFVPGNLRSYAFIGVSLLGLAVLPLYVAGLLGIFEPAGERERSFRTSFLAPTLGLAAFFGLFYNWVDKRFLYYFFPFVVVLFAAGLERLLAAGRRSRKVRPVLYAYLGVALLWNQIRYPSYGIDYLALTPRDFLRSRAVVDERDRTSLHLSGATVVRIHGSLAGAFAGGLFDVRLRPTPCELDTPSYTSLCELRRRLDETLGPGVPVSLERLPGWPADIWSSATRMSNELLRPVLWIDAAPCRILARPAPDRREVLAVGPYRVGCSP